VCELFSENLDNPALYPDEQEKLSLLEDFDDVFSLEDGDRGDTDVVEVHMRGNLSDTSISSVSGGCPAAPSDAGRKSHQALKQSLGKPNCACQEERRWPAHIC